MGRPILIIVHSEQSTPGRIGHLLKETGYSLDIRRPCLGDALPETMAAHDGAVIFGGPMSANDSDEWIAREIDWIGVPLKEKKPFLGVCLGAQMMAKHLGGTVGPHPQEQVEIGYYPIRPTPEGEKLGAWPTLVYQWHRESFSMTHGMERLATGDTFENQAVRYGETAWGIQFHPEVTRLLMHRWAVLGAHRFVLPGAQQAAEHLNGNLVHDPAVRDWLDRFLTRWLQPVQSDTAG
ncbi:glutamine amidotransferase [Aestuariivirga sp.]|uniref:glutamine amidotransferase n=1 Tax=Aestuariivirga sp. TaxID=2650926 RepID=UPI0039E71969